MTRSSVILVCFYLAVIIGEVCLADDHVEVDQCIEGPFHKKKPSPEGPGYVECQPWKEKACCTANFTAELKRNNVEVLYNFTWDHCGNLSAACERYIKNEECFWSCEPNLIKWHTSKGALKGVPICSKYCDDWYNACKNDLTCAENWLNGFSYTSNKYICKADAKCEKFSEVYKDGKGLCEKMWGKSFTYEKSDNCMVMWFTGENPNERVEPTDHEPNTTGATTVATTGAAATCYSKFINLALVFSLISSIIHCNY